MEESPRCNAQSSNYHRHARGQDDRSIGQVRKCGVQNKSCKWRPSPHSKPCSCVHEANHGGHCVRAYRICEQKRVSIACTRYFLQGMRKQTRKRAVTKRFGNGYWYERCIGAYCFPQSCRAVISAKSSTMSTTLTAAMTHNLPTNMQKVVPMRASMPKELAYVQKTIVETTQPQQQNSNVFVFET